MDDRPSLAPQRPGLRPGSSLRPQSGLRPGGDNPPRGREDDSPEDRDRGERDSARDRDRDRERDTERDAPEEEEQVEEPDDVSPLESAWTFWFDKRATATKADQYQSNLKIVGDFNNVQDFWRYFNHLKKPSDVDIDANYHLFKSDIKPMWEDPANENGGKWVIQLKGSDRKHLDAIWENIVLALVGETLDESTDEICGVVMSRRRQGDKIAIWNRNIDKEDVLMKLGQRIKDVALDGVSGQKPVFPMEYSPHKESMASGTSYSNKALLTIPA